jgi:hypothetical protein
LLSFLIVGSACSSTSSSPAVDGGPGIVTDPATDNHCSGVTPILVSQASCHLVPDAAAPGGDDGGASDDGGEPAPEIHFNAESDDDDCKYHVKFTATPVLVNQNVTFNVTVTKLAENNAPAANADVVIESYVANNDLHVIPNSGQKATENPPNSGKYLVGPIRFDMSGRWVVRFHFYETCDDIFDDSPHGHVGFYYDVP